MLDSSKVIQSVSSVLTDLSLSLSNLFGDTKTIALGASDALYIGSDYPFNHRFLDIKTASADAKTLNSIKVWDGSAFNAVAEIWDDTQVGGYAFGKSGIIGWVPDRNTGWSRADSTENVTGLTTLKIYDKYWVKLSFSGAVGATLNYVGHKFSSDEDLEARGYPDLVQPEILDGFKQGKSNWKEQHIIAAEEIIRDLKSKQDILNENQLLSWQLFQDAGCHKVAEIVYRAYGRDFIDNLKSAQAAYSISMNKKNYKKDTNANAILRPAEKLVSGGFTRV